MLRQSSKGDMFEGLLTVGKRGTCRFLHVNSGSEGEPLNATQCKVFV